MTDLIEQTDLLIIGAGMAGMSAALFAANRNVDAIVAGGAGGFEYASGLLDLWGASLTRKGHISKKPWDMIHKLPGFWPNHPLACIDPKTLKTALEELILSLKNQGLIYTNYPKLNTQVVTPFGTVHPTYCLPIPLKANALAWKQKEPCLVLDFKGLREFSAVFFKEAVKKEWKGVKTACIRFPGTRLRTTVFTPFLAKSLETRQVQDELVKRIKPHLNGCSWLGVPAVLGVESSDAILHRLEAKLGVRIFEIPTSPVSVPGMRLKQALSSAIENSSVRSRSTLRVTKILKKSNNGFECLLGSGVREVTVKARAVLLATGRFLSSGLKADRNRIYESLFDLPVSQPESRENWHSNVYFDPGGHPVHQAGIETDSNLRPVDQTGQVIYKNLYAAGGILAHQDWMRNRCGSGLSIGTGFHAIQSYLKLRN